MRKGVKTMTGPLVRLPQKAGGYFGLEAPGGGPEGVGGSRGCVCG